MQNRSLLLIVQKSKGALHAVISVLFMVSFLLTAEVWGATPVGTIITNTAATTFSVNGIGGFNLSSNNYQFAVENLDNNDTAIMNVIMTPNDPTPSAGDTLSFDVNITNAGGNTLANAIFNITAPNESVVSISSATLLPSALPSVVTPLGGNSYGLSDLPSFEVLNVKFDITLSMDIVPGSYTLDFEFVANALSIVDSQIPITVQSRTVASMEILRYDANVTNPALNVFATDYFDGANYLNTVVPTLPDNVTLVTDGPISLIPATEFANNEIIFFKVIDSDHNYDPLIKDTVEITFDVEDDSEIEIIKFKETAVNSGIFTGYIVMTQAVGSDYDGNLNVKPNDRVNISYMDEVDNSSNESSILVDPYGVIFDSKNGIHLDGFTVRLVNAATGLDADVFGDDGVSTYPATLISGGSAVDSSANVYNFGPGFYRFPLIAPGQYYLEVTPPALSGYHFPTTKSDAELASTPGGPYAVDFGSRGETFTIVAGPPLHLDLPVDSESSVLYVKRSASKDSLEQGDFLQYLVTVENTSILIDSNGTILTDTLPRGFRYRNGSAKIDQSPSADPQISGDGRTLSFDLGNILLGTTRSVTYVIEAGAVKPGEALSSSIAHANAGVLISNTSTVKTLVKEAFMRSENILMGRVLIHDEKGNITGEGIAGVRIYMENGSYSVTDDKGRYHFDGVTSGTHVLQLDLDTLPTRYEAMAFEKNTRFAGRAWSQFIDLHGGTLWRADFHAMQKPAPRGHLRLNFVHDKLRQNDQIHYRFNLQNKTVALDNLKFVVMLPQGTQYISGSSIFDGKILDDPQAQENILTYSLDNISGDFKGDITFAVQIKASRKDSYIAKTMLTFDTPTQKNQRSTVLEDVVEYNFQEKKKEYHLRLHFDSFSKEPKSTSLQKLKEFCETLKNVKNIHINAIGYSGSKKIRARSYSIHKHNQVLSKKRAQNVVNFLKERLSLSPSQISIIGKGILDPIADNATKKGRATNRRVELFATSTTTIKTTLENTLTPKSQFETQTLGKLPDGSVSQTTMQKTKEEKLITYDGAWLSTAQPGISWLLPEVNELPAIASLNVAIKHHKGQNIKLLLNNTPVPLTNFESEEFNKAGVAISRWKGIDLVEGDNHLSAIITNEKGEEIKRLSRSVHYSSPPVHAEFLKEESILIADGITPPVITLQLRDRHDYPARRHIIGEYSLNSPYAPLKKGTFDQSVLPGAPKQKIQYTVEKDGLVKITLEPTTQSGEVKVTLPLMNGEQIVKAYLVSPKRDWIIVGFAEGTVGHNTLSSKFEALDENSVSKGIYSDGKVSFFAKGQVKGEWLLTMAYDSEKETGEKDSSLFQTIDPQKYYTVYGDTSSQGFEAASREKLYLKLERDEFYVLFGDYNTNLSDTRLSSYTRALTGIKSEYHDETYDVVLFGSESNQAFIHDEMRGNGTTGPYSLSRRNILMNSEKVVIETRDRFHSEKIIESRELARHSDYQIDYINGTITFRESVAEHDPALNNIYIITKYESFDEDDLSITYGGRVVKKIDKDLEVGVTHISEGKAGGKAELTGADATLKITNNTVVYAEVAHSKESDNSVNAQGNAFLAEIQHRGEKYDVKAYAEKTGKDFGIRQGSGAENGTEKIGVLGNYHINKQLSLNASTFEQKDTQTKAKRDVIEVKSNLQLGDNSLNAGARTASDKRGDGTKERSEQIILGASRNMMDNKLKVSIDHEHSMGSSDSIDYPTLTRVSGDYLLTKMTSLYADHTWTDGANRKTESTKVGIKTSPWNGSTLFSGITHTQESGADTTAANVALTQKYKINELWSMDFGVEKSKTLSNQSPPLKNGVPYANGSSSDYTSSSIGVTYNPKTWIWNARIEQRTSDIDDTWLIATSAQTDPSSETSLLTSLRLYDSKSATSIHRNDGELRLDIAYRPLMGPWIILDKLQLIKETNTGGDFDYENRRIVNSINANYFAINRWQLALQLGVKYVQEYIDKKAYSSITNLYGSEIRYDITKEWDIGFNLSVLHSINNNQYDGHAGFSVGHSFMKNVWMSVGYNFIGFYDRDFSQGKSTSKDIFIKFRIKFDQESAKNLKNWLKQ
jgi:uncharacterized repeat protein (TIGR01451 family)